MTKRLILLPLAFLLLALPVLARAQTPEPGDCLGCHRADTPGAVSQWQRSAHASAGVGCAACHGEDHNLLDSGLARVDAERCGTCHAEALAEHRSSKHGLGLHAGWGCTRNLPNRDPGECRFCHEEGTGLPVSRVQCARFLKQSSEMGELGCNRCHQVENSCASCHTNHGTDLSLVRDPAICSKCHMGPDHPQWEMWQTSIHGILFRSAGAESGPSCQTCHMPEGTHDVSLGLTMTPGVQPLAPVHQETAREEMVAICVSCHGETFSRQELARGDAIRDQSLQLVKKAEAIVWDLYDRELLDPMPQDRPAHPHRGSQLVTDGHMLYEEISHIERLLFKMKKFDLAKTVKGAYHQNPAYTHWYGNAELKMDLVDIQAEARRLEQRAGKASGGNHPPPPQDLSGIEKELRALQSKHLRGALEEEEYQRRKQSLLEQIGRPETVDPDQGSLPTEMLR